MKKYQDYYFHKAKAEHYPARSVYKLKELDAKFGLLKRGMRALDLGAAPGSWTLACAERAGAGGFVLACDLKLTDTAFPPNVVFMQADVFAVSGEFAAALRGRGPFDIVLSDMAPSTTGSKFTDQARSASLAQAALYVARANLRPGGNFVAKIFMGPDVQSIAGEMRGLFRRVHSFKPRSSRSESKETFLVGMGLLAADAP